ncbi:MAG: hypothetical protein ABIL68_07475 [bacterium]
MKKMFFCLCVVLLPLTCWAQWESMIPPMTKGTVSMGVTYQKWSREGQNHPIEETVLPMTLFYPLRERVYLNVSNSPGSAQYHGIQLSGFSDTWIRTTYVFPGEKLMANVGVGAPTGKTGLTEEEFGLSSLLSENAFRFRLPCYGQGLCVRAGLALAHPVSENTVLGVGATYIHKLAYHPLDDADIEYHPGNEASLFVGLDTRIGSAGKWNWDVVYTLYEGDRLNEDLVYGSGNKLLVSSSLLLHAGNGMIGSFLRWRQKGKNEYWIGSSLEPESMNSNGNQLEMDVFWQFFENNTLAFRFLGEGRM